MFDLTMGSCDGANKPVCHLGDREIVKLLKYGAN